MDYRPPLDREAMRHHRITSLALGALMLSGLAHAQPETLGRLLLTPAERASLEHQRLRPASEQGARTDREDSLTVNGEVRRSDGRSTRWINGKAEPGATAPAPGIPVGDRLNPATGAHERLLGNGRITIKPATTGR